MAVASAISIEVLVILGTWPIPFLLGGVIGWTLRGCLAVREAGSEGGRLEPESDESEAESTEVSRKATTWWVTSEGRGRCLHVRPDCSTLSQTRGLTKFEFEGAKPTAILKNGKELSPCSVCEERPRRRA